MLPKQTGSNLRRLKGINDFLNQLETTAKHYKAKKLRGWLGATKKINTDNGADGVPTGLATARRFNQNGNQGHESANGYSLPIIGVRLGEIDGPGR